MGTYFDKQEWAGKALPTCGEAQSMLPSPVLDSNPAAIDANWGKDNSKNIKPKCFF